MQLIHHKVATQHQVRLVAADHLIIGERRFYQSLILTATTLIEDWPAQPTLPLSDPLLETILALAPDVVLIGVAKAQVLPEPRVLGFFLSRRIGCEMMNLAACARTFNVLVSEGRNVAAALVL